MYTPDTFYSTDQIVRHSSGKTHFFDAGSKRFFNSRIGQNAYATANPFLTLFTTSEQFTASNGWTPGRKYSIRVYDSRSGDVNTVGKFQDYASGSQANREAKRLALVMEYTLEDQHEYALLINMDFDYEKVMGERRGDAYRLNQFKRSMGINPWPIPKEIKQIRRGDPEMYADYWAIYGENFLISSSDNPAHPQGVWDCCEINDWSSWNTEFGDPSSWGALPLTLQQVLVNFFTEKN